MGYNEWPGSNLEEAKQHELRCNENLFKIYEQYHQQIINRGIKIYNVTPGSRLKVFPTTTLFNIFEEPTMENI
jgi:hypothetical protein